MYCIINIPACIINIPAWICIKKTNRPQDILQISMRVVPGLEGSYEGVELFGCGIDPARSDGPRLHNPANKTMTKFSIFP